MPREVSPATRRKISAAMKGRRNAAGAHAMTDEGKAAISTAQKARWVAYRVARDVEEAT
jgi:hypothetical protein